MRKTILTIIGSALLATSTIQIAAAAEHHRSHKIYRAPAPVSDDFRNSNAYYGSPSPRAEPGWSRYSDWSRYNNAVESPPAGH